MRDIARMLQVLYSPIILAYFSMLFITYYSKNYASIIHQGLVLRPRGVGSPIAEQDDGTYTCIVTVTGGTNVMQTAATDNITITVMGI